MKITLKHPVADERGSELTAITLRRPKARDLMAMTKAQAADGDIGAMIAFIASIAGVPTAVVDDMDAEDFMTVSGAAQSFLPAAAAEPTSSNT
jgi:hypothetical protein